MKDTDCYAVDVAQDVTFEAFVTAFYTTWLFKMELVVLRLPVETEPELGN